MPAYKDGKYIAVPCEAAVLKVIETRAAELDVSLGHAALALLERGMQVQGAPASTGSIVDLTLIGTDDLCDEIKNRLTTGSPELVTAAVTRAEAAEGQLATLREQLRGALGDA